MEMSEYEQKRSMWNAAREMIYEEGLFFLFACIDKNQCNNYNKKQIRINDYC